MIGGIPRSWVEPVPPAPSTSAKGREGLTKLPRAPPTAWGHLGPECRTTAAPTIMVHCLSIPSLKARLEARPMAKKRSSPKKNSKEPSEEEPEAIEPAQRKAECAPFVPDRRALEGIMRNLMGGLVGAGEETPLGKARRSWTGPSRRTTPASGRSRQGGPRDLARLADAYILLAEQAEIRKEALDLYAEAMAAGERTIGPDVFRKTWATSGACWRPGRTCGPAREWPTRSGAGPTRGGFRPPPRCSASTRATTRVSATSWPPGS